LRDGVACEFPAGYDGSAILERLAQVLDPELDESILDLVLCARWSCVPVMPASRCGGRSAGER
jgi:hypothetical protein